MPLSSAVAVAVTLAVLVRAMAGGTVKARGPTWDKHIEYSGDTFFDGWEFFDLPDPSHGLVSYVDRPTAFEKGLAFWTSDGVPGIQADHFSQKALNEPRESVRISTKALFDQGLFIIDVKLMPWGCAVWPAFWMLGYAKEWPYSGEIDIIEGIQSMTNNQYTIHTDPGCSIKQTSNLHSGSVIDTYCDSTSSSSPGCSIVSPSKTSYGMDFNKQGGGVFAMRWNDDGIRMWSWNRADVPKDISTGEPEPESWITPHAYFDTSGCDINNRFTAQQLILNVNLCGDWAGSLYDRFPYCPGTCAEHIMNPANLNNTIWLINYIKVFQRSDSQVQLREIGSFSNQTGAGGPVSPLASKGTHALSALSGLLLPVCGAILLYTLR